MEFVDKHIHEQPKTKTMLHHLTRIAVTLLLVSPAVAQLPDSILITQGHGGFSGSIPTGSFFGSSVAAIGDLDGNGVSELAVGAPEDPSREHEGGAVYILFMDESGLVLRNARVFLPPELVVANERKFGSGVAAYVDVDEDRVPEILVTSKHHLWLVYLDRDGRLKDAKILARTNSLARSFVALTSIQTGGQERMPQIALGETRVPPTPSVVILLYLEGSQVQRRVVSAEFTTSQNSRFSIVDLGDADGDGSPDLAISLPENSVEGSGATDRGILIQFLKPFAAGLPPLAELRASDVVAHSKVLGPDIPDDNSNFPTVSELTSVGDLDRNGFVDLAGVSSDGRTSLLFLEESATIDWLGSIKSASQPGGSMSSFEDLNEDGAPELVLSNPRSGGRGAIWISFELGEVSPEFDPLHQAHTTAGQPVRLETRIRGTHEIQAAAVWFRPAGYPTVFQTPMTKVGFADFTVEIPAIFLGAGGFEYFIQTDVPAARYPASGILSIPTRHPGGLSLPSPDLPTPGYELVSIPLELDSTSASFNLEDDLGPYDVTQWRFFELDRGAWKELSTTNPIRLEPGIAYAIHRGSARSQIQTDGGQTVRTDRPFSIRLRPGWNLVGNPFAFDIPIENIRRSSFDRADLWAYDTTWTIETGRIQAFEGYAVFARLADTMFIDPDLTENPGTSATATSESEGSRFPSPSELATRRSELEAMMSKLAGASEAGNVRPVTSSLRLRAYPNPFTTAATIDYELAEAGHVRLEAFDVLGRRVATLIDEPQTAGLQSLKWRAPIDRTELADGLYILQLRVEGNVETVSVILSR